MSKISKKKNAKKKSQEPKRKFGRYILGVALLIPVLLELSSMLDGVELPTLDLKHDIAIRNVKIDGELQHVTHRDVQQEILELLRDDFVRLDLRELRRQLESNPWFKYVSVKRAWPSTLIVKIEEQQPIARWGDKGFLNRYGEIVKVPVGDTLNSLPMLKGNDTQAYSIARDYLEMARLLRDHGLFISSLAVSPSGQWTMQVNQQLELALGDREVSKRVERFLYLYSSQSSEVINEMHRVDMRYENGIAVQWKRKMVNQSVKDTDINNIASR